MIRSIRNATLGVLAGIVSGAVWLVSASALWCKGTGSAFTAPWLQWWNALAWWGANCNRKPMAAYRASFGWEMLRPAWLQR